MRLQVRDLAVAYGRFFALRDVSIDLSGGVVGLVGPNGSGKSTLLKCLDGLISPVRGDILIDEKPITRMGRRELARKVGYVPQLENLMFPKTVLDTVLMGRIPHGTWAPSEHDIGIVSDVIEKFGLGALADRDLNSLSGGQRQKVMIARSVAQEGDILLLDEPTSSLDLSNQIEVMETIKAQSGEGKLVVMAVHDLNLALRYCDSFILLKSGGVVASGDYDSLSMDMLEEVYGIKAKMIGSGRERTLVPISRR